MLVLFLKKIRVFSPFILTDPENAHFQFTKFYFYFLSEYEIKFIQFTKFYLEPSFSEYGISEKNFSFVLGESSIGKYRENSSNFLGKIIPGGIGVHF